MVVGDNRIGTNQHLAEISKCVSISAIALLILDGAGWHSSPQLILPENIGLMPHPSYAPEQNSVENIWDYLRSNFLSHCIWDTYEAILDACCDAWNASWPNPRSSPQLERENGHRSKLRAIGIRCHDHCVSGKDSLSTKKIFEKPERFI